MSGILGGGGGTSAGRHDDHLAGGDHTNLSFESAVDHFRSSPSPPPASSSASARQNHQQQRRVQITRGADGLVSGIGRPVMRPFQSTRYKYLAGWKEALPAGPSPAL
ncbi:hypothetical protein PGT21_009819 [Puccinia graminis f. sp. tritici]|uniref:Uncharacterized protein n=1 Tax=Puccinia graminis f. sp. tritici TaxID=56615 RepID=A0A5B0MXC9_PUCGR|nr:hypothetical protein PGT21_009819 [Puccinia graminis f. sp. tritici]KAA1131475.1 hypothetical protein PGTUg99_018727 [Puccinia graminis f. sp. tritici]